MAAPPESYGDPIISRAETTSCDNGKSAGHRGIAAFHSVPQCLASSPDKGS